MTGFGLLGAVFMAILSTVYLKQIPGNAQLSRLKKDLNDEYGDFFDPNTPLEVKLALPSRRGEAMSITLRFVLRKDLRGGKKELIGQLLQQMGEQTMRHPFWRGKIGHVAVLHVAEPKLERIVRPSDPEQGPDWTRRAARLPSKG